MLPSLAGQYQKVEYKEQNKQRKKIKTDSQIREWTKVSEWRRDRRLGG